MKKKNVTICLSEKAIKAVKELSENEGRSMSNLIESIVLRTPKRPVYPYEFIVYLINKMRDTGLFMKGEQKYTIDAVYEMFKTDAPNMPPEFLYDGNTQQWYDYTDEFLNIKMNDGNVIVFDKSGNGNHLILNGVDYKTRAERQRETIHRNICDNEKQQNSSYEYLAKKHNVENKPFKVDLDG